MNNITRTLRFVGGLAVLGALGVLPLKAKANLVINGTFENPSISGWGLFTSIPGWTATSDLIEIGQGSSVYGITGATGQVLELDANHNATVAQGIALSAGSYDLTFDVARRLNGMDGRPFDTADLEVLWNGNVVAAIHPGSTTMTMQSLTLTGIDGVNTLAFRGAGTDDSYGALVDNVVLESQAVPEPGTWALMVGMGVFGAKVLRARKRR